MDAVAHEVEIDIGEHRLRRCAHDRPDVLVRLCQELDRKPLAISFLKRCVGWTRCAWRSLRSFTACTWASVVTANRLLIARRQLD
jgi:hypothetical protein